MIQDKTPGSRIMDACITLCMILSGLICILPLLYTLCLSLREKAAATAGLVSFWPVDLNFNAYKQIMIDTKFIKSFATSVERVALGNAINYIVIILMAYPLSKRAKDFRPRNIFMWVLVFTMLFNGGLIPWYQTVVKE
jgi:putative aldouronate transport system permease protein